jgi:hypothetical protein
MYLLIALWALLGFLQWYTPAASAPKQCTQCILQHQQQVQQSVQGAYWRERLAC